MKIFRLIIAVNIFLVVVSCGTLNEGFSNQKKNNSDEFLVEKKAPLVMPPDYNELPTPKDSQQDKIDNDSSNSIKSLLQNEDNSQTSTLEKDSSSNFEQSIIEKIRND